MGCCCCADDGKRPISKGKKRRECTDCWCFLIFVIFLIGMAVITAVVILDDGFDRLRYGYDSFGNICDRKNPSRVGQSNYLQQDTTGLTNVLYFNYLHPAKSIKACVQSCPNQTINTQQQFIDYTRANNLQFCLYNITPGVYDANFCPRLPMYQSVPILNRCVPNPNISEVIPAEIDYYTRNITTIFNLEDIRVATLSLYKQLPDIGLMSLAATVFTIILVVLLRYVAHIMVILVILLCSFGSLGLTVFLWLKFNYYYKLPSPVKYVVPLLDYELTAQNAYLIYSIMATVLTLILLLVLLTSRKRIFLMLRLFAEAQKALTDMMLIFTIPLFTFIVLLMFLFYWLSTAIMIYSFGQYDHSDLQLFNITSIPKKSLINFIWIYHIVALIWISEFIFACQSMVIASSVVKWYFTRNKHYFKSPICSSIKRLVVYHLGSIALGAFIIVLVRLPRYVLQYFQATKQGPQNSVAKTCSKMCICCLYVIEKFLKFVNYNAYIVMSIESKGFCTSAEVAFNLIVQNSYRVAIINSVGDFILFLAKLTVTALTLVLAFFWFNVPLADITNPIANISEYKYFILPMLIVAVISFLIAHSFFTIYEMVVDAMLICFCEDVRANDGSEDRPYYMSSSLKKFIDESSQAQIAD